MPGIGFGDVLVFLGNGDGTLQPPTTISLNYAALSLVQVDVNGDGNQDLVLLQVDFFNNGIWYAYISAEVSVLIGNGDGAFKAPINTSVPAEAIELAVGDVDGNGKPNVVTANQQSFSILLGNGDGTFRTPVTPAIAVDSVALEDFTGDGKLDLVVSPGSGGFNTLSILLGNGNGTFQNPAPVNLGATCDAGPLGGAGPFVVDLNGDGKPDLVDTCGLTGVVVLLGNGDGTFGAPEILTVAGYAAFAVVADFNVDGKPDLATANGENISVLLGRGDGTFIEGCAHRLQSQGRGFDCCGLQRRWQSRSGCGLLGQRSRGQWQWCCGGTWQRRRNLQAIIICRGRRNVTLFARHRRL